MIEDGTLVPADAMLDATQSSRSARSSRVGVPREVSRVSRAGDHRHPASQCEFLQRALSQAVPRPDRKAIAQFDMLQPGDRVLVAVSGGKDSLAVWDILNELGYDAEASMSDSASASTAMCRPSTPPDLPTPEPHAPTEDLLRDHGSTCHTAAGPPSGTLLGVRPHQAAPVRRGSPPGRL